MNWISWTILGIIVAGNVGIFTLAFLSAKTKKGEKSERPIKLSKYTPEQLLEECNRHFNDPNIYWI